MTSEEQSPIFIVNAVWQVMKIHRIGGNGQVYVARHTDNNTPAAVKSEHPNRYDLEFENDIFDALDEAGNPEGFPRRLYYGIHRARLPRRVLVMNMLGDSLLDAMGEDGHQPLSLQTTLRFGMQAVRRLQTLHGLGFLHRDVKPDNFLVGREGSGAERTVHLIDFGNVQRFMVQKRGRECHMKFQKERMNQTLVFGSEKATRSYRVGRKDDLESLIYVMVYLATGHLPWEQYNDFGNRDHITTVGKMKAVKGAPRGLFNGLPTQLEEAYRYIRNEKFSAEPRYDYVYQLFQTAITGIQGHQQDRGVEIPLD